jgi:hypothetical protein
LVLLKGNEIFFEEKIQDINEDSELIFIETNTKSFFYHFETETLILYINREINNIIFCNNILLNKNLHDNIYIDFNFHIDNEISSFDFNTINNIIYQPNFKNILNDYKILYQNNNKFKIYSFDSFYIIIENSKEYLIENKENVLEFYEKQILTPENIDIKNYYMKQYNKLIEKGFYWNPKDYYLQIPKFYIYHLLHIYFLIRNIKELKSKDIQRKVFNILTDY